MNRTRHSQFGRILCALAIFLVCRPFASAAGEDVSRQPPQVYLDKVAPLLTPLDEVLRTPIPEKNTQGDGVILLDEEIHYLDAKGYRCVAYHRIYKALNDSAVKGLAEDVWGYRKANQKIHLVLARTILPDGRQIPVQPGATMIQTPQREADYSLYNDMAELRVIFPNVKPGTITELIVVIEESQFRIPGEFTGGFTTASGWPTGKFHFVIEMPDAMAARLKITNLGHVPEPVKEQPEKGRQRFTWRGENVDPLPREINVPPVLQTGPALMVTTLPDWDAFVRWYAPQVEDRSAIKPALASKIDEWTKGAKSPAEILNILMSKVATDVRYVGLEFGTSDLQPHDCNAVWDNQYGDCKDKANLLRAMLQYKGIDSSLVLLNTDNTGQIEKRSPDYRQFTHAIVAVELEHGKYIFCDPTISYAKPGLLSPDDADRDVLLIKKNGAEWAHTPPAEGGTLHYDFDLKLEADGGISGWMTLESTGYYATAYAYDYERLDKENLRSRAGDLIQAFYKAAEIVDVTKMPLKDWDGVYRLKLYFVVPGSGRAKQGRQTLAFPQAGLLFVNAGTKKTRETPYYLWADKVKVTAHFKLPAGVTPQDIPQPYKLESPAMDAAAQWSAKEGECAASLEVDTKLSSIQPDQFEVFFNSLYSLHAWLDNPLSLSANAGTVAAAGGGQEITLDNFPMMPTGDGQIALVNERFPDNGNLDLRREALKKTMQYFPSDKTTLYNAGISLAIIDWQEKKGKEAAVEINDLLKTYRGNLGAEDVAWGEYTLARIYQDLKQEPEAQKIFEHLADETGISDYRRSWACYHVGLLLQEKSATAAIKALRRGLAYDTDAQPSEFTLLAKVLLMQGRAADLKKEIAHLLDKKPRQYAAMLASLADSAADLLPAKQAAARGELMRMLDDAGKSADLGKNFQDSLQASHNSINAVTAGARIRESLKQYLAKNPPAPLDATAAAFKTRTDFLHAIDAAEKDRKPDLCLRYAIEILVRFEADTDFSAYVWKATSFADWNERSLDKPEPLLPVMLDLSDQLPPDNESYLDGRLLRAKVLTRKGDFEGSLKINEELARNPKLPQSYKIVADERMAGNLESLRNYAKALEVYHTVESEIQYADAKDCLLRAVFLNLEMGKRDEALRLLSVLGGRSEDAINQAATGWQILELTALAKEPGNAAAYWDATAKWWPAWLELEKKLGMKPLGDELVIPALPTSSIYNEMDAALRAKDRDSFFQNLRKIAHAARWEPALLVDLARITSSSTPALVPERAEDLRRFTIQICEPLPADDEELKRKKQLFLAANCFDDNADAKTLQSIHDFENKPQKNDAVSQAMARLWGMEAKRQRNETGPAIGALEKSLAGTDTVDQRILSVTILADLYRLAGRTDDEEKLLKREMENPQITSSPQDLQTLAARHDLVAKEGSDSRQLSQAVERWLQNHKPAWYDFAEPKTLGDPRLSNLDAVLKDPERVFLTAEIVKLNLLVATATSQPYERRQQAFLDALEGLEDCAFTKQQSKELYEPLVDDEGFPEGLRVELLWRAINNARREGRAADFEKLVANPLQQKFNDRTKTICALYHDALAVDQSSSDAVAAYCEKLMQSELTPPALGELRTGYARLLVLARFDAAEKIYKQFGDATLSADVQTGKAELQLEFLKLLNLSKKWLPVSDAMRKLVLAQFPAESITEPPVYATLRNPFLPYALDEEKVTQVSLYEIKTQQFDVSNFTFWIYFIRDLPRTVPNRKLVLDLIGAALENAPGDMERAQIVRSASSFIDGDNPDERGSLLKLEQPYRKPEEFPETYAMIRMQEIRSAWRSGQRVDTQGDFANLHSSDSELADELKLGYLVQTKNIPLLKNMLDSLSPDSLLSDSLLDLSLHAYDLAGMKDELQLARDAAKKAIYRSVLQSWMLPGYYSPGDAYDLSRELHDSSGIPAGWYDCLVRNIAGRHENFAIRCEDARLRQDWPQLLALANEGIGRYPTYYSLYWLKGLALYRMDKTGEAAGLLQIYTRYSKDESDYPQAMEWLEKIQPVVKQTGRDKAEDGVTAPGT